MADEKNLELLGFTADVVSAYVANNSISANDLPNFIASIHAQFESLTGAKQAAVIEEPKPVPAVNPKKSVFPDYIICLEDGKRFKSLKRHLSTHYNTTPDEYRTKWGLPADYPMVAPAYAAARSALAKTMGLGRRPKAAATKKK